MLTIENSDNYQVGNCDIIRVGSQFSQSRQAFSLFWIIVTMMMMVMMIMTISYLDDDDDDDEDDDNDGDEEYLS